MAIMVDDVKPLTCRSNKRTRVPQKTQEQHEPKTTVGILQKVSYGAESA